MKEIKKKEREGRERVRLKERKKERESSKRLRPTLGGRNMPPSGEEACLLLLPTSVYPLLGFLIRFREF